VPPRTLQFEKVISILHQSSLVEEQRSTICCFKNFVFF